MNQDTINKIESTRREIEQVETLLKKSPDSLRLQVVLKSLQKMYGQLEAEFAESCSDTVASTGEVVEEEIFVTGTIFAGSLIKNTFLMETQDSEIIVGVIDRPKIHNLTLGKVITAKLKKRTKVVSSTDEEKLEYILVEFRIS